MSPVTCALSGEDALRKIGSVGKPTVLHIVDALPRNASGKVMKTALRQEYR
jgi:acyl-coenzyme A synthetase/AMP-(fatty) acid ligase